MTGLLDPVREIEKMEKELEARQSSLASIKFLFSKLPDLRVYKYAQSKDVMSCSSQMNGSVDAFDVYHRDTEYLDEYGINTIKASPKIVDVWLYTTVDGHKIYSNPPCFTVGHENESGFGIVQAPDWEAQMDSNGIALSAILKVRAYLKNKPEISW